MSATFQCTFCMSEFLQLVALVGDEGLDSVLECLYDAGFLTKVVVRGPVQVLVRMGGFPVYGQFD